MLYKIAWKSFFRQARNYNVYFISMMMAVMIYYSFNAMTADQLLTHRASQDVQIGNVLRFAAVFVLLIVLFFMLSANRFFVNQRRKEIAIYQLLGVKKSQLSFQLLAEVFVLNFAAFILGIIMGIIFSKFFAMILIKMMDLNISSVFFISWRTVLLTGIIFLIVFLIISLQNSWLILNSQLVVLFQSKSDIPIKKMYMTKSTYLFGVLSLLLLAVGYGCAFFLRPLIVAYTSRTEDFSVIMTLPLLILFSCVLGTYLFYRFGLKLIFQLLQQKKSRYQHLRFLSLSNSRMHILDNWRTLSFITLIAATAIAIIGMAISIIALQNQTNQNSYPSDFQVDQALLPKLEETVAEAGGKLTTPVDLTYKVTGAHLDYSVFGSSKVGQIQLVNLLALTNYESFAKKFPRAPQIQLKDQQETVMFNYSVELFQGVSHYQRKIDLTNQLTLNLQQVYPDYLGEANLRYGGVVLLVSDEVYRRAKGISYQVSLVDLEQGDPAKISQAVSQKLATDWQHELDYQYRFERQQLTGQITPSHDQPRLTDDETIFHGTTSRLNQAERYPVMRRARRVSGLYIYVAIFIGMIVFLTTASLLMLRQFFEANNERENYRLLKRMGIGKKQLRGLIYRQSAWLFLPPIIIASAHACLAIYALSQFVTSSNYWLAYLFSGIMALLYGIAYLLTVQLYASIIEV